MKKCLILSLFAFICSFSHGQREFPSVTTETITGKEVVVPDAFRGKFAFIGVGTSKRAEDELRTWQVPVYNKFVAKTGLMDDMYNVELCFLPLFTGAMKAAKSKVVKKLRENNEKPVLDHVYIYAGNRGPFDDLGLTDRGEPYFFLIDPDGRIAWSGKGSFKQRYLDDMEEILSQ
jgi:hypothetical protein